MMDEMAERRWPALPFALGVIGLGTGMVVHAIIGDGQGDIDAARVALLSFVTVSAILFGFVVQRGDLIRSLGFAAGWGAVSALILFFNGSISGWGASEGWRLFSLALAIGIAAPLFQAGRDADFRALPYARLHDHAWTNVVLWCLAWAFAGIVMLLAFLLAALFDLIGIRFPGELLQKGWVWRPLIGLGFGAGLALLREHSRIVATLQNVAMLVLGVLAPVLAMGLGLFLLSLPFTGLQPLWDATKATTPILLTCAAGALLLVNAVVGNGGDDAPRHAILRWAALVLAVAMLPLVVIAQIATALRIDQYGYTPERLWALTFVILATIYSVAYLVSVVRGRRDWAARVRPANRALAVVTCGIALLLATPLLSFNAISTRDQVARLESGRTSADKFDWRALAFDFGEPGRAALQRLQASGSAAVRKQAGEALAARHRYELESPGIETKFTGRVEVIPASAQLPPALRREIDISICPNGVVCRAHVQPGGQAAVIVSDGCATGLAGCRVQATIFSLAPKGWAQVATVPFAVAADAPSADRPVPRVELRDVTRRQLFVDGQPRGAAFE